MVTSAPSTTLGCTSLPSPRHEAAYQGVVVAAGVVADDDGLALGHGDLLVDEDGGGGAVEGLVVVLGVVHEDQVAGAHAVDLVDPGHRQVHLAHGAAADQRGDLRGGQGFGKKHRGTKGNRGGTQCICEVRNSHLL
jgi:hypothetical protein